MQTEEFQRRVLDFQDVARADLAKLKTQMTALVGEAQPGRIDKPWRPRLSTCAVRTTEDRSGAKSLRHGVTAAISAGVAWLTAHVREFPLELDSHPSLDDASGPAGDREPAWARLSGPEG